MPLGSALPLVPRDFVSTVQSRTATLHGAESATGFDVVFRRNGSDLAAQAVRVLTPSSGAESDDRVASVSRGRVVLVGAVDLDVEVGDRFNYSNGLYEVAYIQPNRHSRTRVDCDVVRR